MAMMRNEAGRVSAKRGWGGLLALLAMAGCAHWRPVPVVEVAPDPVMYPAPFAGGRYIPWTSGLAPGEAVFLGPFGRIIARPRLANGE